MVVLRTVPKHRSFNRIALIRNYKCYKTQEDRKCPINYYGWRRVIKGLQVDSTSPSLNLPVIPTFRDIANLIECVAMFCFVKRLLAFRIMTDHAPTATIIMDLWSVSTYLDWHGLRHSFATRCIESNCDYKTVSVLLGHANIRTTLNLYVHPNMGQKKKCITRMFKSLGK